jgi:hypothetical protein
MWIANFSRRLLADIEQQDAPARRAEPQRRTADSVPSDMRARQDEGDTPSKREN